MLVTAKLAAVSIIVGCAGIDVLAQSPPGGDSEGLEAAALKQQAAVRSWLLDGIKASAPSLDGAGRANGQREAMVGREDLMSPETHDHNLPECVPLSGDPLGLIVEGARQTNIVIISERHSSSRDRYFVGLVLEALSHEGYSIYAAETFSPYDDLSQVDALGSDGWYSNDPMFGRTIQRAHSLGYRLVAYEQTADQAADADADGELSKVAARERDQARNLMDNLFSSEPNAKVVIHAGYGHASEFPVPSADRLSAYMAGHLKALTGQDPFTVSQHSCSSSGASTIAATNLIDETGSSKTSAPLYDLYVGQPKLEFDSSRPSWRQEIGDTPRYVSPSIFTPDEAVILEARPEGASFAEGASLATVPIDRVLVFPGERVPLLLPPGRYQVDGFGVDGRFEARKHLKVERPASDASDPS